MAKIDFKENGGKGVKSSKNSAQEGKEQAPKRQIRVEHNFGTLIIEGVSEARKVMGTLSFHNRVIAQLLSDKLQDPKSADAETVCALGYLNRDIAELICAIEIETGGQ